VNSSETVGLLGSARCASAPEGSARNRLTRMQWLRSHESRSRLRSVASFSEGIFVSLCLLKVSPAFSPAEPPDTKTLASLPSRRADRIQIVRSSHRFVQTPRPTLAD
jgi:hypothetical protein